MTRDAPILVFGANGQVGFELCKRLARTGSVRALSHSACDLTDTAQITAEIATARPSVVINAAAYTAVDKAESEEALAHAINAAAPGHMAREAERIDALLVHYSTDYVFDGEKAAPYVESDAPNPQSAYGRTKLEGERQVVSSGGRHLIFRTSWVAGAHGANFLKTILRLARERDALRIIDDQFGAPTSAEMIADVTAELVSRHLAGTPLPGGIYHLTNAGSTSWHGYATHIVNWAAEHGVPLKASAGSIAAISTEEYPLPARRPKNSRLDTSRLRDAFTLTLPPWQDSIDSILQQIA